VTREVDSRGVEAALRAAGLADVRSDPTTRAAYSSDASLYRVLPRAVAFPRAADEVATAVDVAGRLGVAVTARGAGTSVAGNAVGPGLVLDLSRHLDQVLDLDPESRLARVQPGVVLDDLQRAARPHGLRFGPDPSTHSRCTIGGMIGNDACGSRALAYGRTSDNVAGLRLVTGTAAKLDVTRDTVGRAVADGFDDGRAALAALVRADLAVLRTELGRFDRQISGYALHHLLPERGADLARALVGSEGTLGVLTEATVRLVAEPGDRLLVVLGYADIADAGDAAAGVRAHSPTACEGIDARIVDVVRQRRGEDLVPELPHGAAWLLVELSGDDRAETSSRARRLVAEVEAFDARIIDSAAEAAALWRIREDGAGLAGRAPSGAPAWAGWEDAAVPPGSLGPYLREFEDLVKAHGLTHMPFGHFGDGCVHTRLDFPLATSSGPARLRSFLEEAAALVARHGGSLSGEHGDGRARSELLPHLYSPRALELFAAVKRVFDPGGILNPGVLVDPAPVDASLRLPVPAPHQVQLAFGYDADDGSLVQALHRCTGVARCRTVSPGAGTVMCPSYAATQEEKDSTRGRARVLQELVNGSFVKGWRDPAVRDALDLCLSCKGCASDCPTGIDMATYKSEVLHQSHRWRVRPRTHYSLGWLPRWARLASRAPGLANRLMLSAPLRRMLFAAAGIDRRRAAPAFADDTFRSWFAARTAVPTGGTRRVTLFVDSFTDVFAPEVGQAMVQVLEEAGYRVSITGRDVCCGLTWISTGQLDAARRILTRSLGALAETDPDIPLVGIEPSCTAVFRHDAVDLLRTGQARDVAGRVVTLAELLGADPSWSPPDLRETRVVAQPHCHHHAVMGWEADAALLARAGAAVERLGGCCGLAGNFGMETGHYEVSIAVAEQQLAPALRTASSGTRLLADGFSCRTQAADLLDKRGAHLAQLLAASLPTRTVQR
jgi:FAD/FMN-containing dehydrogenase/Fe-S oxidoreductase